MWGVLGANEDRRARVVVVGAGAIGLAVALQLGREGVDGVVVVDRNASPGMGSTSRANGGVRAQFTTPVNIAFSQFTIKKLRELHELAGLGANVLDVWHERVTPRLRVGEVEVLLQVETRGPEHCDEVITELRQAGYTLVFG